jgi:hypothetical protein
VANRTLRKQISERGAPDSSFNIKVQTGDLENPSIGVKCRLTTLEGHITAGAAQELIHATKYTLLIREKEPWVLFVPTAAPPSPGRGTGGGGGGGRGRGTTNVLSTVSKKVSDNLRKSRVGTGYTLKAVKKVAKIAGISAQEELMQRGLTMGHLESFWFWWRTFKTKCVNDDGIDDDRHLKLFSDARFLDYCKSSREQINQITNRLKALKGFWKNTGPNSFINVEWAYGIVVSVYNKSIVPMLGLGLRLGSIKRLEELHELYKRFVMVIDWCTLAEHYPHTLEFVAYNTGIIHREKIEFHDFDRTIYQAYALLKTDPQFRYSSTLVIASPASSASDPTDNPLKKFAQAHREGLTQKLAWNTTLYPCNFKRRRSLMKLVSPKFMALLDETTLTPVIERDLKRRGGNAKDDDPLYYVPEEKLREELGFSLAMHNYIVPLVCTAVSLHLLMPKKMGDVKKKYNDQKFVDRIRKSIEPYPEILWLSYIQRRDLKEATAVIVEWGETHRPPRAFEQ